MTTSAANGSSQLLAFWKPRTGLRAWKALDIMLAVMTA
jgi:hypothetical protein